MGCSFIKTKIMNKKKSSLQGIELPNPENQTPFITRNIQNLVIETDKAKTLPNEEKYSDEEDEFLTQDIVLEEKSPFKVRKPALQFTPSLRDRSSDEELGENHAEPSKGSPAKAVMFLMNTIIGGGIVTLPFVMSIFGIFLGILIFICVYLMTIFSCVILLRVKNNSKRTHYGTIGTFCFGYKGKMLIDVIIIINNFGMCMSYFIIFGQNLHKILVENLQSDAWWTQKYVWIILIWLVILPFVFFKDFDRLKFVSFLSTSSIIIYFLLTLYTFFIKYSNGSLVENVHFFPSSSFDFRKGMGSFPSVFLAFTFQYNFFPVYKTVKNVDDKKMLWISFWALTLVLIVYCLVGVCGYLSYGEDIHINFLESISIDDIGPVFYYILLIAFSSAVSFSVPLFFFGCRNYILSLYHDIKHFWIEGKDEKEKTLSAYLVKRPWSERMHPKANSNSVFYITTIVIYLIVLLCATSLKEIGPAFNVIGAICANAISFLLPAAFYLKINRKKFLVYKLAWVLLGIGLVTGVLSLGGEIALNF